MSINSTEHGSPSIVTQIRDLLPLQKHAVFHVKLVIHQLQSVPLISGEFRIKWKFRHLQAVNSAGRPIGFGRALALKFDGQKKRRVEHVTVHDNCKGKGKEVEHQDTEENYVQNQDMLPLPFPILPGGRPHSPHSNRSRSKHSTSSSTSTSTSNFHGNPSLNTSLEDPKIDYRAEARGHTPFLPLRDFNIDFESEINVAVQMSIDKDSLALLSSELKLTVMQVGQSFRVLGGTDRSMIMCQRVIPNDPEAPLNPRLGHVDVNLAEYVDAGPVTRKYLLRRSKVNAMLNVRPLPVYFDRSTHDCMRR
jgi:N-terminal C2 in EEIG1 and EHBP1 proteins